MFEENEEADFFFFNISVKIGIVAWNFTMMYQAIFYARKI